MLTNREVETVVKTSISKLLPNNKISYVRVEEDVGALNDQPTLSILVVFKRRPTMKGEDIFALHDCIQRRLAEAGDDRYAFLRYVGEKEARGTVS